MELQQEPHVFQRQRRIRGITRIRWIRATTGDNTDQKKQISLVDFLLRIYHFTFSLTDVIFTRKFCLFGISSFGPIFFWLFCLSYVAASFHSQSADSLEQFCHQRMFSFEKHRQTKPRWMFSFGKRPQPPPLPSPTLSCCLPSKGSLYLCVTDAEKVAIVVKRKWEKDPGLFLIGNLDLFPSEMPQ